MGSYLDVLNKVDFEQILNADHIQMVKQGGIFLILASVLLVMGLLWFLIGVFTWRRGRLKQTIAFAFLVAALGWGGSYYGYTKAEQVTEASETDPKPSEVDAGAANINYTAFAPTGAALGLVVLSILGMLVVRDRKKDDHDEH